MKKIKGTMPTILVALGLLFIICIVSSSCKREAINYSTTSTVNMLTYLKQNPDKFSYFVQIIEKAGYGSFLDAYGAYTLFAPTNDGVSAYLKKISKASVADIDAATAKALVSMAIIQDTISSSKFKDGKLQKPSLYNQYIITGAANVGGVSSITINKQANLLQSNIRLGNGIMHVVDNVITPATLTLAKMLEQDAKYSIFTEALKATGYYDSLNYTPETNPIASRKFLTVVAQTNDVFKAAGFNDFNALKQRYSKTGNPKNNPQDSLNLFVGYRVYPEVSYLTDLAIVTSHATLAPQEVTTSQLIGQDLLLNNIVFNGVLEPGISVDRTLSDVTASNGVLHAVKANYTIKVRLPTAVYFDVADQSEIKRTPGLYRVPGSNRVFLLGSLADVTWLGKGSTNNNNSMQYFAQSATSTSDFYYGGDYLAAGLRFRNDYLYSATFKTPLLVKGRYKVWIDYKVGGGGAAVIMTFDGVALPNIINFNDAITATDSDGALEAKGYKRYSESLAGDGNGHVGRFVGVINIPTTDRHSINISNNTGNGGSGGSARVQLDVIEFRPIDMNQIYPKLGKDGTLKY